MKTFVLTVAGLMGLAGVAGAINPGTTSVKAQVASNLSVLVTGTFDFGIVAAGATGLPSTTAVTVQNNGTGVTETYRIKLTDPATWVAVTGAPAASEEYRLQAQFNSVQPLGPSWSPGMMALTQADVIAGGAGGNLAGDQTGFQTGYLAARSLWFLFDAPVSTAVATQQTINITITATTP